jgi:hypothetical protein
VHDLTADEPGNYRLSHTPDGLVALLREVDGDLEVVGVRVPLAHTAQEAEQLAPSTGQHTEHHEQGDDHDDRRQGGLANDLTRVVRGRLRHVPQGDKSPPRSP